MNDKKSMRIFWISLCLLVVSAALIIVAVQYRGRRVPLEGGKKSDQINPAGEPHIQTDSNTGAADVSDNASLAKNQNDRAADSGPPVRAAAGQAQPYQFELREKDGYLDVYHYHTQQLYFHTGIPCQTLSAIQRQAVNQGKYFQNEEELYGYLESCTS
ncbi:MAG: hypothetical protein HFH35_02970 [Eubacterium sp.]|nr:hypothetical protein [Eubacterium sp.]